MKLPGKTLIPCRNQMLPMSINIAQTILTMIFMFPPPVHALETGT
jgi:hypothetical protein